MKRTGRWRSVLLRAAVTLAVLVLGGAVAAGVVRLAPTAARAETERQVQVVDVIDAEPTTAAVRVEATGTVVAAQTVVVTPEVGGRIVDRNAELIPGGRLAAGDLVARIDARDYRYALEQEEARVSAAALEVETEESRGRISRTEWASYGDGRAVDELPLVSRRPHLEVATSNLSSAQVGVARAKLNLSRTVLRAPWNAVVIEAQAEVGQVVSPATKVATLVGTDRVWVRVAVPVRHISDLDVPGAGVERGARAHVHQDLGDGRVVEWSGEVVRLEGQLEPQTRNARLLVSVEDPFEPPRGGLPLLPGSFVTVHLEGREAAGVFEVPRSALHEGSMVWVVGEDDRLATRRVEVRWGTVDVVFVSGELRPGDRVVTSALSLPLVGERVRIRTPGEEPAA